MCVDEYLLDRGLSTSLIKMFLKVSKMSKVLGTSLSASGFEYVIDHFLDGSGTAGYDIKLVNQALRMDRSQLLAIAIAEGDDPICLDLRSGSVILLLIEDGEQVQLASTLDEFASIIVSIGN